MKKVAFCGILMLTLAGCKLGLPADDPYAHQPKFEHEKFDAHWLQQDSRQAVRDLFRANPELNKSQHKFLVASAYNSNDYSRTYKIGRAIGAGLTQGFSQSGKESRQINLRPSMLKVANKGGTNEYIEVTNEAIDFANRMNFDTIIAVNYFNTGGADVIINMNVIRVVDNQSLAQFSYSVEADQKSFALSKQY